MSAPAPPASRWKTWLLIAAVIALAVVPLLINRGSDFGGSDDAASKVIAELRPGYQRWMEPIWTPPGGAIESLLFALQAALGAGVIGYFFGLKRGQRMGSAARRPPVDDPLAAQQQRDDAPD